MQTLNVSCADYARHFQIYLSLLANRGVEIQICFLFVCLFVSHARGSVFFPWHRQYAKLKYAEADFGSNE